MKDGWKLQTLGEVCSVVSGTGFPKQYQGSSRGEFPFFKVGDMNSDGNEVNLTVANNYISDVIRQELGAKALPQNTIVFPKIGGAISTNKKRRILVPSCVDNNVMGLVPKSSVIDPDYLFAWMASIDIYDFSNKAALPSIKKTTVEGWPISLPPLEEQKRIVSILDQAFEGLDRARANAEANLESARELNESIKTSVLARNSIDGKRVKLSEVSDITSSLVDPKQMEYCHLPHIGAGNMVTLSDDLIEVKTAAEENLISQKYLYDDTMVLYSKIRPYLRKAARPSFGGLCSADVYPLKPTVGVLDRDFLFHILLSDDFTKYAEAGSARAGMPKVNRKHLFNYEFSLPSISDQKDMVAAIDRTKGHIALLVNKGQRKLSKVEDLRQSLLQKAFSGELT